MLKLPLISFIVTSYNYEKFILKTLESIKEQSYESFEIIVVDDASSDNSTGIIEEFITENPQLHATLFVQKENQGQFAAMLKGLKEAQGQFVSFIDSDDVLHKDYAKTHLKVHMATSVALTSSQIFEIGENDEIHTIHSISSPQNNPDIKELNELLEVDIDKVEFKILNTKNAKFGGWHWAPNSSAMYRKSSIELLLNFKNTNNWKICPDKFLLNFAHLIGGSAVVYAPLVGYRRHSQNAGNCSLVTGDKRLHSDYTTSININNNIKIRPETIKFLLRIRKQLGKRNTARLIFTVLLSYI